MMRGHVGWVALCCLALSGGGCSSRRESAEGKPPEPAAPSAPAQPSAEKPPETQAPEQKETPAMATTLECKLSVPASVPVGQPVELLFQLTNRTAAPLYVLSWRSPLERVGGRDFDITRDGAEVAYQGPMKKRGAPSPDQYLTVAPGATVEGRLDLALAYDLSQPGRYRIAFPGPLMDVTDKLPDTARSFDVMTARPVTCAPVETTLTKP